MRKVTFTNSKSVPIEFFKYPYLIESLEGIDTPSTMIQAQKAPYQDGATYIDTLLDERVIVITGAIVMPQNLSAIAGAKTAMQTALNPKLGLGQITLETDSGTYYASGYVESVSLRNKDFRDPYQRFQVTIRCDDPYWYGDEITVSGGGLDAFSTSIGINRNLYGIDFGNGVFIAVSGGTSTALVSDTWGNTWAEKTLPALRSWEDCVFGNGVFLAIASTTDKCALSSDNGNTWTEKTLPASRAWLAVAYGNGVFLAIANNTDKCALSSDNGNTWSEKTLPASRAWRAVAYGNGVFLAIAYNTDKCAVSSDNGNTWSEKTLPSSRDWLGCAFGDGVFAVFAEEYNKIALSSDNGNTWTEKTITTETWGALAYGNGQWCLAAYNSDVVLLSSDNFTTYSTLTLPEVKNWYGMAFGASAFVITPISSNATATITGQIINIESELETPVEIQIDGPNAATEITLNNNETLSVNKSLVSGEKILINTRFGQRSIYFYPISGARSNAMQYLDTGSTFWQLKSGYNNVFFTSPAILRYRERHIGV